MRPGMSARPCSPRLRRRRDAGAGILPWLASKPYVRQLNTRLVTRLRIAVISDTHNRYPPDLPQLLREADEIWHLGDVCEPETLVEFELLGRPLHVVMGNNDPDVGWPITFEPTRGGVKFHLTHIPPNRAPPGVQAVLHGHTHVPRDEVEGGVRWLNPGCISHPHRGAPPSFAWLSVANGRITGWDLVRLVR